MPSDPRRARCRHRRGSTSTQGDQPVLMEYEEALKIGLKIRRRKNDLVSRTAPCMFRQ